jgi:hypothetical protein
MNVHPPQCDEDKDIGDYQEPILIWIFSFISATENGQIFRITKLSILVLQKAQIVEKRP